MENNRHGDDIEILLSEGNESSYRDATNDNASAASSRHTSPARYPTPVVSKKKKQVMFSASPLKTVYCPELNELVPNVEEDGAEIRKYSSTYTNSSSLIESSS